MRINSNDKGKFIMGGINDNSISLEMNSLKLSPDVRFCHVEEKIVLLNLFTGKYFQFDSTGTLLWDCFLKYQDIDSCIKQIIEIFGVSETIATNDVNKFIALCKKEGFFASAILPEENDFQILPAITKPTYLKAAICIYKTKISLKRLGIYRTYVRHMRFQNNINVFLAPDHLSHCLKVFERAENLFSSVNARVECLPRSLSLHRFLFAQGIASTHYIGVKKFPFLAHAWIEINNSPVFEPPNYTKQFTPISIIKND